ncbi:MAG TPA: glycine cleavage system aminomethyltransferase GcvT [Roseiflexaceae bacterium]|nr:glycine cleavage system aminomethyltransferase GcvT [Roseiflexaceae bacterium]
MPERRSPLYETHIRMGARMVKGGGDYMFPLSYTSPVEEHINTRTNVGMQDLSSMGEVDVKGPGAERLLNHLLVNDIRDMLPGQVRYSTMCNEDGGVVDDITVYKFHDEHFMVVTSSAPRKKTARWLADHAVGTSTYVTDISAAIALPVVQGPRSRELLKALVQDADLDSLRYFRFTTGRIGETELVVSRTGYTGELGFELYTPAEEAPLVWEQILQAGRTFGLMPYGAAAMHTLRLEKALVLYGVDLDESRTPFEAGLDRWIRFSKRDFLGREALLRAQERGLEERLVGLTLEGELAAQAGAGVYPVGAVEPFQRRHFSGPEAGAPHDTVLPGPEAVGRVTTSGRGHTVGKVLALAYVRTQHAWPGARLLVEVGGRPVPAVVTPTPFFDPQGARLRARAPR